MNLNDWAIRWNITPDALEDLRREFGLINSEPSQYDQTTSEGAVQSKIRLEASRKGLRLFRNNVGVALDENGVRNLRYGLANDSKALNTILKSSDLIGIRKVIVTPIMVGCVFGQFVAREVKESGWQYKATEREKAQLAFLELIASYGGDAGFATGEGTL